MVGPDMEEQIALHAKFGKRPVQVSKHRHVGKSSQISTKPTCSVASHCLVLVICFGFNNIAPRLIYRSIGLYSPLWAVQHSQVLALSNTYHGPCPQMSCSSIYIASSSEFSESSIENLIYPVFSFLETGLAVHLCGYRRTHRRLDLVWDIKMQGYAPICSGCCTITKNGVI